MPKKIVFSLLLILAFVDAKFVEAQSYNFHGFIIDLNFVRFVFALALLGYGIWAVLPFLKTEPELDTKKSALSFKNLAALYLGVTSELLFRSIYLFFSLVFLAHCTSALWTDLMLPDQLGSISAHIVIVLQKTIPPLADLLRGSFDQSFFQFASDNCSATWNRNSVAYYPLLITTYLVYAFVLRGMFVGAWRIGFSHNVKNLQLALEDTSQRGSV